MSYRKINGIIEKWKKKDVISAEIQAGKYGKAIQVAEVKDI